MTMMHFISNDLVMPFQLDVSNLRGRLARMGPELDAILSRHDYPHCVANLLAETIILTALLAGMLKYQGVFTLQVKADGPVSMMVADVDSQGHVRAYAQFDHDHELMGQREAHAGALLGRGYLAFTVDQGNDTDRYQGMVELEGLHMADFAQNYFRRSEQIDTGFAIAARYDEEQGWQAGGLMLQRLPEQKTGARTSEEDDWRRIMILTATATPEELASRLLSAEELLFRLFHEEQVRVYDPHFLKDQCRCSRQRVAYVLGTLSVQDRAEIKEQGLAEITCEFCGRHYEFTAEDVEKSLAGNDLPPDNGETTRH